MSSIITVGNAPTVENDNHFLINLCSSHLALVGAFCIAKYNAVHPFSWPKLSKLLALLLTTLIVLTAHQYHCLCPGTGQNLHQHSAAVTLNTAQDLCSDCGHTKRCCAVHNPVPAVSANLCAPIANLELTTMFSPVPFANIVKSTAAAAVNKNRAPPVNRWLCSRTYLAKQTLLI